MTEPYDLMSKAFFTDPYPTYARMRAEDPVYRFDPFGGWLLTRAEDVSALLKARETSSDRVAELFLGMPEDLSEEVAALLAFFRDMMAFADPPYHTRLRSLVGRTFSARNIAGLEGFVSEATERLLDECAAKGEFDVIADLGTPLPLRVIGHILGVREEDLPAFKKWSTDLMALPAMMGEPRERLLNATAALHNVRALFTGLIAERRANPTDDLLSLLVHAEEDGESLTDEQLVSTCALILTAGHETTTHVIGNGLLALLRHPDQLELLRAQPELAGQAVEECLRYDNPSGYVARALLTEMTFSGTTLPAGSVAYGVVGSANRDGAVFAEPDRFDITRPASRHFSFGHGLHMCLGAALARLEARVCLNGLLERFPTIEPAFDEVEWMPGYAVRGVVSLPVKVA
ncbi:cytochrome P450 [Kitasatospora sp. NPDC093102]|uniref:cytochrome P450 n=1 Tax=Kitasatospora sp. NPDC093102 TaxID=3155069 RepID=UPI0034423693